MQPLRQRGKKVKKLETARFFKKCSLRQRAINVLIRYRKSCSVTAFKEVKGEKVKRQKVEAGSSNAGSGYEKSLGFELYPKDSFGKLSEG